MKLENDQNIGTKKRRKVFLPKINYMHACAKKNQLHVRGGCMHVNFF